jgi:ABC-2 type transport system ATP-binding protein
MDTPAKLKDVLGGDVVTVSGDGLEKLEEALENVEWIKTMKPFNSSLSLTMSRGDTRIPEILSTAEGLGVKVKSVNLHKPSLEDVFLHFTGRMIRDQEGSGMMDRMKMRFGK